MNKIWLLLKVNLINLFGFNKLKQAKNFKEKRKNYTFFLLTILAFVVLFYYLYTYSEFLIDGYLMLNVPYILLVQMFVYASSFILFTTIYKANGLLFNFKDYNAIMSFPIKTKTVVISRIILTYLYNIIYALLIMLPSFVVYVIKVNPEPIFYLLYFVTLIILPIVPIIIGSLIGTVITYVSAYFKRKNIFNIIFSVAFMVFIMYINANMGQNPIDAANIGLSLVKIFDKVYPLAKVYSDIIKDTNLVSLLIYIGIPSLLLYLFTLLLSTNYKKLNDLINSNPTRSKYQLTKLKSSTKVISLYKKEFKRYFASSIYVLNTGVGYILLIVGTIALLFLGEEKVTSFLSMSTMDISNSLPFLIALFVSIGTTTSSSISLEGKNLWIIKSLPVNIKDVFKSKVLVNLTLSLPTVIIVSTILSIYFKLKLVSILFTFLIPILYAIFAAHMGLLINLYFPKFDYESEIQVVKQSMAAFASVMLGMLIVIVPMTIEIKSINYNLYLLIIGIILSILLIIVNRIINTKGIKMFENF